MATVIAGLARSSHLVFIVIAARLLAPRRRNQISRSDAVLNKFQFSIITL